MRAEKRSNLPPRGIKKRVFMISNKEKTEKTILRISLWVSVAMAVVEIVMSIVTHSQAVLMDAAVDSVELIVIGVSLAITPLLYQPLTEKRPYGYFQVESLFIVIKGFMLIAVAVSLIVSNVGVILSGGKHIDNTGVSIYEIALGVAGLAVFLILRRFNRHISSPMVKAEIYTWKVDFIVSFALGIAFTAARFLVDTPLGFLSPYFDQIAAIVLSLCLIPRPAKMIVGALRSLLLFPPREEKRVDIDNVVAKALEDYGFVPVFLDVTQTGRKLWVAATFSTDRPTLSMGDVKELYARLLRELSPRYEGIDVELIPLWAGYQDSPH